MNMQNTIPPASEASPRLILLADRAKESSAPKPRSCSRHYDDVLSSVDEYDERQSQAFAETHILGCLTGLKLCRAQAATAWAQSMLDSAIAGMEDTLGDIHGWRGLIEESASRSRRK